MNKQRFGILLIVLTMILCNATVFSKGLGGNPHKHKRFIHHYNAKHKTVKVSERVTLTEDDYKEIVKKANKTISSKEFKNKLEKISFDNNSPTEQSFRIGEFEVIATEITDTKTSKKLKPKELVSASLNTTYLTAYSSVTSMYKTYNMILKNYFLGFEIAELTAEFFWEYDEDKVRVLTPPEVTADIYYCLDIAAYWKNTQSSPTRGVESASSVTMVASSFYTQKIIFNGIGDINSTKIGWKLVAKPDGTYKATTYH